MANNPYSMSFTTGTLLQADSLLLTREYLELGDWREVRNLTRKTNLLQAKTIQSNVRLASEIISRLCLLDDDQLKYLDQAQVKDQSYVIWLAVCRRYKFIADFTSEVISAAINTPMKKVTIEDYLAFYEQKAAFYPEIKQVSQSTKRRVEKYMFKIPEQAGIIDDSGVLLPIIVTPSNDLFFNKLQSSERLYYPGLEI
jgi:hypothetical protein